MAQGQLNGLFECAKKDALRVLARIDWKPTG